MLISPSRCPRSFAGGKPISEAHVSKQNFAFALLFAALLVVPAQAQMKAQVAGPNGNVQAAPQTLPPLETAKRITREDAMKLVSEGKAVFVDVRSQEQYDLGHIKGAISIPHSQLPTRFRELPLSKMLITYCACVAEHTAALTVLELNAHR